MPRREPDSLRRSLMFAGWDDKDGDDLVMEEMKMMGNGITIILIISISKIRLLVSSYPR